MNVKNVCCISVFTPFFQKKKILKIKRFAFVFIAVFFVRRMRLTSYHSIDFHKIIFSFN